MRLIVGLRNSGSDYRGTRHNVGAEVIEVLASRHGARLRRGPLRVRADAVSFRLGDEQVVLATPRSFMNTCGPAVASVLRYHKATPSDLLVVHDDIDLAFGKLRLQVGRGSGGHNGVRSIMKSLGTKDFARLKVGVGRPPGKMDPADYVLRPFTKAERPEADLMVAQAADVAERWVVDPEDAARVAAGGG